MIIKVGIFILLLVTITSGECHSETARGNFAWFSIGAGMFEHDDRDLGLSWGLLYSFVRGHSLLSVRLNRIHDPQIFSGSSFDALSANFQYGVVFTSTEALGSVSWGLGALLISRNVVPCVPLEAQLYLTPFSNLGVGVCAFLGLNPKAIYRGAWLCLQLGKLR